MGNAEAAQLITVMSCTCFPSTARYLEEGNVPAAETQKRQIEQLQRDRRRVMEENNITHQARFFRSGTGWGGNQGGSWGWSMGHRGTPWLRGMQDSQGIERGDPPGDLEGTPGVTPPSPLSLGG